MVLVELSGIEVFVGCEDVVLSKGTNLLVRLSCDAVG